MKLVSVNVALPREIEINGEKIWTGIYKEPTDRPVRLGRLKLDGDGQADLSVHGGEFQAAYSYPVEHFGYWRKVLGADKLPYGTFGENLTVEGLLEDEVCVGDILSIGEAKVQVTMHRLPCFKFSHKVGRPSILKEFLQSGKSGFYHRVIQEGNVQAGDSIELLERDSRGITVRQILGMQRLGEGDMKSLERALQINCLPPSLRDDLEARLAGIRT